MSCGEATEFGEMVKNLATKVWDCVDKYSNEGPQCPHSIPNECERLRLGLDKLQPILKKHIQHLRSQSNDPRLVHSEDMPLSSCVEMDAVSPEHEDVGVRPNLSEALCVHDIESLKLDDRTGASAAAQTVVGEGKEGFCEIGPQDDSYMQETSARPHQRPKAEYFGRGTADRPRPYLPK